MVHHVFVAQAHDDSLATPAAVLFRAVVSVAIVHDGVARTP